MREEYQRENMKEMQEKADAEVKLQWMIFDSN